jgi:hypothetical protein
LNSEFSFDNASDCIGDLLAETRFNSSGAGTGLSFKNFANGKDIHDATAPVSINALIGLCCTNNSKKQSFGSIFE